MKHPSNLKLNYNPSYEMSVRVTFTLDDTATDLTQNDITKLMRDAAVALEEALADTIEGEALAVTGAVQKVSARVSVPTFKMEGK